MLVEENNSHVNTSRTEKSPLLTGADSSITDQQNQALVDGGGDSKFLPIPAFWNTVKAFAGAGSFALPWAVMNAGLWIGSIGLVLIAALSNYTMTILINCSIQMKKDRVGPAHPSFADIANRAFGRYGEIFVCFMNLLVTMCICISYLLLIGVNFGELVGQSQVLMIWAILPAVTLLTFLTDMKYLGFTSIFGALSLLLAMSTVIAYGVKDNKVESLSHYEFDIKNIPLWFGNAAFFFCNHIVVMPISHASGNQKRYIRVLDYAMIFITIVNTFFAAICYLYYNFSKTGIPSVIVSALPDGVLTDIVRVCVCLELTCSFPLVFGSGVSVVESTIEWYHKHFTAFPESDTRVSVNSTSKPFLSKNWKYYIVRVVLCCILAGFASGIKNFGTYLSLIGSLMLAVAGFVIPPLLSLRFFPNQPKHLKIIHYIIIVFGIAATILGTTLSIDSMIHPSSA